MLRVDEESTLDPAAQRVFLVNCLATVHGGLARHACCQARARAVRERLDGHLAGLVGGAAGALLARCGLAEVAERVRLYQEGSAGGGAMAADPSLAEARLAAALRACFALVSRPDALPEFALLQARRPQRQTLLWLLCNKKVVLTVATARCRYRAYVRRPSPRLRARWRARTRSSMTRCPTPPTATPPARPLIWGGRRRCRRFWGCRCHEYLG